ncbi:MAG: class IIb bacteriocin, lactobin A/cerein 7B family [Methylococcales bacterium]|nr:class IIb bacteriocin, lactobin A/cerein 7B family [Methylococcales bacterium]
MRELSIEEVNEVSGGWVWWNSAGVVTGSWGTVAWGSGAVVVNTPNNFVNVYW